MNVYFEPGTISLVPWSIRSDGQAATFTSNEPCTLPDDGYYLVKIAFTYDSDTHHLTRLMEIKNRNIVYVDYFDHIGFDGNCVTIYLVEDDVDQDLLNISIVWEGDISGVHSKNISLLLCMNKLIEVEYMASSTKRVLLDR